jgi:hypothetical protein
MAYDEGLALRVREALAGTPGIVEKKMFGGLGFILAGNMAVGVLAEGLLVRVGPDASATLLDRPHVSDFGMPGRAPMRGWLIVHPDGLASAADLDDWIRTGVATAAVLPPK